MANVIFKSFEEESKKGSGLVSQQISGSKSVDLVFESAWEKDGQTRTKGGKGSLGVNTSAGWMDASSIIKWLHKQQDRLGLIVAKKGTDENGEEKTIGYELKCDGVTLYKITGDKNGQIAKIEKL